MFALNKDNLYLKSTMFSMTFRFLLTLSAAVTIAFLVQPSWTRNLNLYHTILEGTCVFIALSIFVSMWYTYGKTDNASIILTFGYLVVAVFDVMHTYYHLKLDLTAVSYFDLSTRFWILGRLAEAVTMFLAIRSIKIVFSKYINLLIALGVSGGLIYLMVGYHDLLPLLLTEQGVTPLKVSLEYVVIAIYVISLFSMRGKLHDKGNITYKYLFLALLMSICAEICFTKYGLISDVSWTLGHILKIISYFYLFKGSFITTVVFPYNELLSKNEELNKISNGMRDLLDVLPIGVQKYDHYGRLEYSNKKSEELLLCSNQELVSASMLELVKKFSTVPINEEDLMCYLQQDEAAATVCDLQSLKGEPLRLSVKTSKISNGTLVIFNDARKDQELQNLNIQTETILNSINNGVMVIDEQKKIVLVNKVFEDIFEGDKDQILGMDIDHLNEVIHFGAKELPYKVLKESMTGQILDVPLTTFKGNKKELNIYVSPIKNVDGEIIGAISVGTDVTELKKEQQRIVQQEKLALLGQMGAGIVHETRNFLTTIKGRCQLIDMLTKEDVTKKHVAKISEDVDEVNRIMSEFLFLSKPRETELEEVSICDVFEAIKGIIETSSLVKGVDLEIKLCDEERYMLCDESQIKQVILNICKNGIDAMTDLPNARLIVEIGFLEESNEIYIAIQDNGKGIEKENLDKIGTPFFTTKTSGTGLGLSVCYKIVRDHGGRIEVHSELGKGTAFIIILPCIEEEDIELIV